MNAKSLAQPPCFVYMKREDSSSETLLCAFNAGQCIKQQNLECLPFCIVNFCIAVYWDTKYDTVNSEIFARVLY